MGAQVTDRAGPTLKSERTSTEDILDDAKEVMFDNPQEYADFQKRHSARLTSNGKSAVRTGDKSKKKEREVLDEILGRKEDKPLGEYQPFVGWAIKHHRQLLTIVGKYDRTPLAAAIDEGNHEFVKLVLEHADKIEDLLSFKYSGRNCLQYAIDKQCPFAEAMINRLGKELGRVTMAKRGQPEPSDDSKSEANLFLTGGESQDKTNMTALHIATENIETTSAELFTFKKWTRVTGTPLTQQDLGNTTADKEEKPVKVPSAAQAPRHQRDEERARDAGRPAGQDARGQQHTTTAPRNPVQSHELDKPHQFNPLSVVRALIKAEPEALCKCNSKGDTPFQARLRSLAMANNIDVEDSDEDRRNLFEKDEILAYMREYIIENFGRKQAMEALYKEGSARTLTFDLFGLPYPSIDVDFLEGLEKVLRFEGLLKYVALPRVAFRDCKGLRCDENRADTDKVNGTTQKRSQDTKDEGHGRQDMCDVFHWLRGRGVSSILTIKVMDDGEVGHSDEAIEKCMKDFGVRSWNWLRVDLSCDVILTSAKEVRDVALFSSGNNAVLAGWSSPLGLVKLEKLKNVRVLIQKGLERKVRLEMYANDFKKKIKEQRPEVTVTCSIQDLDSTADAFFTDRDVKESVESTWMRTMVNFGQFFFQANKAVPGIQPVKIAIIDDGINPTLNIFNNRIKRGESFHQFGETYDGRRGAFYVPSGPHGTLMAQLICKVCPMVELYIAQLEVFRGQHGQRSFRAESAAEAITWAVKQGVDIISMSWYINEDNESGPLGKALADAAVKDIIMFCSSIDEGATVTNKTYPGMNGSCIKIGASTDTGARLSWVSSDCHYLLPGDARHGMVGDEMKSVSQKTGSASSNMWSQSTMDGHGHFGSSVSTALAAGLAGTLLFSERLVMRSSPDTTGQKKADYLHTSSTMKFAFQKLCTLGDKFIHWQEFSTTDTEPWVWNEDLETHKNTVSTLKEFVKKISK